MEMAATKSATGTATKSSKGSRRAAGGSKGSKNSKRQGAGRTSAANRNGKKKTSAHNVDDVNEYRDRMAFETGIVFIVILILAVFTYLSFLGLCGVAGNVVGGFCFGVFGWVSWVIPAAVLAGYIFNIANIWDSRVLHKELSFSGILLALSGITDLLSKGKVITEYYADNHGKYHGYLKCMDMTFKDVMAHGKGTGGIIGRWLAGFLKSMIGSVGAGVILVLLLLLFAYMSVGMELMGNIRKRNAYRAEMEDAYEDMDDYDEPSYRMVTRMAKRRKKSVVRDGVEDERGIGGYRDRGDFGTMQSVDFMKMNERLDKMEQQIAASAAFSETEEKALLSPDISWEAREQLKRELETKAGNERMAASKEHGMEKDVAASENKGKRTGKTGKADGQALSADMAPIDGVPKGGVSVGGLSADRGEAKKEVDMGQDILDIPIYREEMKRKFGRRQSMSDGDGSVWNNRAKTEPVTAAETPARENGAVGNNINMGDTYSNGTSGSNVPVADTCANETFGSNMPVPDAPVDNIPVSDNVENKANASGRFAMDDGKEKSASQDGGYSAKSNVQIPETAENAKEPMASFAPKTDEPDIVPASQKRADAVAKHSEAQNSLPSKAKSEGAMSFEESVTVQEIEGKKREVIKPHEFPSIELLTVPKEANNGVSDTKLRMTAAKLQSTLKSFNVNVQMGPVTCGPTVTRYELQPEQGVRVNKITNLADDLKLSLAAASIRIEAPIPGKSAVGIEVPNESPSAVYFRELLNGEEFKASKSPLTFAVGKDIAGKLIMTDIAKMPHLLIAGATGSGKSVCINTLIMSILYKADPKDVKIIMIDPKVVELSVYNGIPHLFCPVVTDPKEAAAALNWAVREMMDRYETFKAFGVRNIAGYNEKIKGNDAYNKMSFLVIIVDEFADLMMVASKDVEDAVCRLAQLARAAGIHLVLATQRPSVNVITGVIKANIPSRIAFSVSSAIDSRTILDKGGAEKLLGKGDMLFFPSGYSEPVRVQGAFISDREVSDVVDFLCESNMKPEYNNSVTEIVEEKTAKEKEAQKPEQDEYFAEAGYFVIESERAAAGQLQRRFSIGFNRAGRILDQLHRAGVVGPAEGTKPRRILMTKEEFGAFIGDGAVPSAETGEEMNQAD